MTRTLLLVHGAGSGPCVFAGWAGSFGDFKVTAVDLQAGLDPAQASMGDYADAVVDAARRQHRPVASAAGAWAASSSVPSLPCPSLVVSGDEFRAERGRRIAEFYGSEWLDVPGSSHWDLVRDTTVREPIRRFLES